MILTRKDLKSQVDWYQENEKVIGFTSGCFDILHAGHIDFLRKARQKCHRLIVGVNSDESIKSYKGKDRPITNEQDRIKIINALQFVDYAFIFDERNNNENIKILKPDIYFKAGDYKKEDLSSAPIVEKYGGEVIIIPVKHNTSTTKIVEKIKNTKAIITKKKEKIFFVDRDGTIIKHVPYLSDPNKVELYANVVKALKEMQTTHKIIIVTNQPGIGLGYFTQEDYYNVNSKMLELLNEHGIVIDKIFHCPHTIKDKCDCRKPNIGLFKKAEEYYIVDKKNSCMVGDSKTDIEAGKKYGVDTSFCWWQE